MEDVATVGGREVDANADAAPAPRRRRRSSGSGERGAVAGYRFQWRTAAPLILAALRRGELDWIALADPDAGQLDDLQIGFGERIDAYQIRSQTHPTPFTYANLTAAAGSEPALVEQLAQSWRALREASAGRVVVHLRTNRSPSVNDAVPDATGVPSHFGAFLSEACERARQGVPVPDRWSRAWENFRRATALRPDQFDIFVRDLELEFGARLSTADDTRNGQQERADEERLVLLLADLVSDPAGIVRVERADLIARLGLDKRLAPRNRHEFPVDPSSYTPIAGTAAALAQRLDASERGYIAVLGSPGSGKSTLLTDMLRRRSERVIPYYAYVPEAQDPLTIRGESVNFLHDVVVTLERYGFRSGTSIPDFDRDDLKQRLASQLSALSTEFRNTGRKTVILIDGLDHIDREQQPSRSLLLDLPLPESVPDGVVIVLGSQTDAPFPPAVRGTVGSPERQVFMQRLERSAVAELIERVPAVARLNAAQKQLIWEKSAGHPLALRLLIRRIEGLAEGADPQEVLDETEPIQASIEEQYRTYWEHLSEHEHEVAELVALVARVRPAIDLTWVARWTPPAVLARFRRVAYQYFDPEAPDRWRVFHNSFRVFVEQESARARPGTHDPEIDRAFHRRLAEHSRVADPASPQRWETLYHLVRAGNDAAVLALATTTHFREQLDAFRPVEAIRGDIELALRVSLARRDIVAITRLFLARAEFSERADTLERHPIADVLLVIGDHESASMHVHDGRRLRVGTATALSLAPAFENAGHADEARQIFEIAEPLWLLQGGVENLRGGETMESLDEWAAAAVRYRSREYIQRTIDTLRVVGQWVQEDDAPALRARLRHGAALEYAALGRWEEHQALANQLKDGGDFTVWFSLKTSAARGAIERGDVEHGENLLREVDETLAGRALDDRDRIALAQLHLLAGNRARAGELITGVDARMVTRNESALSPRLDSYRHLIRLVRVRAALGDEPPLRELIPEPEKPEQRAVAAFERVVCAIAQVQGRAMRGRTLPPIEMENAVLGALRIANRDGRATNDTSSYWIRGTRADLSEWIVTVIARSGGPALDELRRIFENEWADAATSRFWSADVRRRVILALTRHGAPLDWARQQLATLIPATASGSIEDRVDACIAQARAEVAVGETQAARRSLVTAARTSLGVSFRKDHEFDDYLAWAASGLAPEDAHGVELLGWSALAVETLDESTEGPAQRTAADEVLRTAAMWSPVRSIRLFRWFWERGSFQHASGLAAVLGAFAKLPAVDPDQLRTLVTELLMPVSLAAHPDIARALIARAHEARGPDAALALARRLKEASEVFALSDTRAGWRHGIAEGLALRGLDVQGVGLNRADTLPDEEHTRVGDRLQLTDGSVLSRSEVRARLGTPDGFERLLQDQGEGDFDWASVVDAVVPEQLGALAEAMAARRRGSVALASVASALAAAGDRANAWTVGQRALKESIPEGWDEQWDGGSRLRAFQALYRADPARARPLIFESLQADQARTFRYAYQVATNLREVVSMLNDDPGAQAGLIAEVEQHLRSLFAYATLDATEAAALLAEPPADPSPSRALTDLVIFHLRLPAFALLEGAVRALAQLLLRATPEVLGGVEQALKDKDDTLVERVLAAVHAAVNAGARPNALVPALRLLADGRDSAIAYGANAILVKLGETPVMATAAALPAIYQLQLNPDAATGIVADVPIMPGEPLRDSSDPRQVIGPYDSVHVPLLARMARVGEQNLLLRTAALMREVAPEESWNAQAERALFRRLDAIGLSYTYVRPRARVARRALMRSARELERAGQLPAQGAHRRRLLGYDPALALVQPGPRPAAVVVLKRPEHQERAAWIAQPPELRDVPDRWDDRRVVVAQMSTICALDWGHPKERRRSALYPVDADPLSAPELRVPIALVPEHTAEGYPQIEIDEDCLAVRNYAGWFTQYNWLAFQPELAQVLGWTLDSSGLFRWRDASGAIAVESLWWRDGSPPVDALRSVESAEGWVVLASDEAIAAIAEACVGLKNVIAAWRSVRMEDRESRESSTAGETRALSTRGAKSG